MEGAQDVLAVEKGEGDALPRYQPVCECSRRGARDDRCASPERTGRGCGPITSGSFGMIWNSKAAQLTLAFLTRAGAWRGWRRLTLFLLRGAAAGPLPVVTAAMVAAGMLHSPDRSEEREELAGCAAAEPRPSRDRQHQVQSQSQTHHRSLPYQWTRSILLSRDAAFHVARCQDVL